MHIKGRRRAVRPRHWLSRAPRVPSVKRTACAVWAEGPVSLAQSVEEAAHPQPGSVHTDHVGKHPAAETWGSSSSRGSSWNCH